MPVCMVLYRTPRRFARLIVTVTHFFMPGRAFVGKGRGRMLSETLGGGDDGGAVRGGGSLVGWRRGRVLPLC